jgi:transcriptional regulator with XRE-family HTH domain
MSQRELGRAIGTSASAVAQWETGDTEPSVDNRVRISQALNIPIAELMPSEAVQSARAVDAQEAVLLERWRQLAPEFREAFLRILQVQIDAGRRH